MRSANDFRWNVDDGLMKRKKKGEQCGNRSLFCKCFIDLIHRSEPEVRRFCW